MTDSPFGFLRKKKHKQHVQPPERVKEHSAILGKVKELFSRGFSEPEVFRALKKEGINSLEIDRGIREYLKSELGTPVKRSEHQEIPLGPVKKPKKPLTHEEIEDEIDEESIPKMPDLSELKERMEEEPMSISPPSRRHKPIHRRPDHEPHKESHIGRKEAEELIEVIVKEKFNELQGKLDDFESKMKEHEAEMKDLGSKINKMLDDKETEIQGLSKKMDTYKDSMDGVKDRMDGIKTALEQTLVNVTDKMSSLDTKLHSIRRKRSDDD